MLDLYGFSSEFGMICCSTFFVVLFFLTEFALRVKRNGFIVSLKSMLKKAKYQSNEAIYGLEVGYKNTFSPVITETSNQ